MAGSASYGPIEEGYELDDHSRDKEIPDAIENPFDSNEDLRPILPQQGLPPLTHPQYHDVQPDSLGEDPLWEIFFTTYDIFLCFIAFVLLLKTSLVVYAWHDDKDNADWKIDNVSKLTLMLIDFNEQVVTAFTIVFITIMTTVTRRLALYKAQQGAYISDLEQLQASVSLPSVIKMVFYLRKFTKLSFMLVAFWCFYYLGSQAARREYAYASSDERKHLKAAYPNSEGFSEYYALKHDGTVNHTREYKVVPSLSDYSSFAGLPLSVQHNYVETESKESYTYWTTTPVIGDFTVETSYLKMYCDSIDQFPFESFPSGSLPAMMISFNMTNTTGSEPRKLEIWQRWDETFIDPEITVPANATRRGSVRMVCNIVQPRVQVGVHCSEVACLVNKFRCPQIDTATLHNTQCNNATFASIFFSSVLLVGGGPETLNSTNQIISQMGMKTIVNNYINGRSLNATNIAEILDPWQYFVEELINTWYNLGMSSNTPTGGPTSNISALPEPGFTPVSFKGAFVRPHYAIYWHWIGIDYFSGFLLLAAAIYSFWLRKHTLAPDIFGFVSSLTRDNPHFPVPPGGSTLDGLDRTRALRNMQVRIGEINDRHGGAGRVAFLPVNPQIQAMNLMKERKYV